jgi:TetR/AcrR family transcriptional regulator, transcriptional repressor for nem operon
MSKGDLTRQRIVELAAPLFNQRGYEGCSMHDVMQATGLEKGGLYRHFSCKEELAAEAFRYALQNAVKTRTEGLDAVGDPLDQLRFLIRRFVEEPSFMAGGCPLLNTAIDADDGNPLLRKLVLDAIEDWKTRLSAIVQEGIRRREIRRSADPCRIATTIIATLEGALMISRLEGSKTALRDAQKSLDDMLNEIACPAARKKQRAPTAAQDESPEAVARRRTSPVQ